MAILGFIQVVIGVFRTPVYWPALEREMEIYLGRFHGVVLNAGSGNRDLSNYLPGKLINLDLPLGLHNDNISVFGSLEKICLASESVDGIICNAVLEHVAEPDLVLEEFARVLKPNGILYLGVPFLQPEHLDPTDFQRWTLPGLTRLVEKHGFKVRETGNVHSVYHTLGWILSEWLNSSRAPHYLLGRLILFPWLNLMMRISSTKVHSVASAYRVLAYKLE